MAVDSYGCYGPHGRGASCICTSRRHAETIALVYDKFTTTHRVGFIVRVSRPTAANKPMDRPLQQHLQAGVGSCNDVLAVMVVVVGGAWPAAKTSVASRALKANREKEINITNFNSTTTTPSFRPSNSPSLPHPTNSPSPTSSLPSSSAWFRDSEAFQIPIPHPQLDLHPRLAPSSSTSSVPMAVRPDLLSSSPDQRQQFLTFPMQQPTPQQRAPYNNPSYLPNGPTPNPVPGATPLLPNQGRILQAGPTKVLCIADVRGRLPPRSSIV
jgi:hypothetical protein